MRPPVEAPLDIAELIAKRIASQYTAGEALLSEVKAWRLVSRAFADAFEPYLFSHGSFTDASSYNVARTARRADTLIGILSKRPSIGSRVKHFDIYLSGSYTHPLLPLILERLEQVEDLSVNGSGSKAGRVEWNALSEELREALLRLALRPRVRALRMEYIQFFPATVILKSYGLTKLGLSGSSVRYTEDMEDAVSRTSPWAVFDLDISCANAESIRGWLSRLDHPGTLLGGLRSLTTKHLGRDDPHINAIISLCGEYSPSLESLDITLHRNEEREFFHSRVWLVHTEAKPRPPDAHVIRSVALAPLKTLKTLHITFVKPSTYGAMLSEFIEDLAQSFNQMETACLEDFRLTFNGIDELPLLPTNLLHMLHHFNPILQAKAQQTNGRVRLRD